MLAQCSEASPGGVIGRQIGSGRGATGATIDGAISGGALGHQAEQKVNASRFRTAVRLDSGSTLIVEDSREADLRVGDRVRVEDHLSFPKTRSPCRAVRPIRRARALQGDRSDRSARSGLDHQTAAR